MSVKLSDLKETEAILAGNYWENFKYHKDLAQMYGGSHWRVTQLNENIELIRNEWHDVQQKIKALETEV